MRQRFSRMSRRQWMATTAAATLGQAAGDSGGIEPIARSGPSRLRLSLAAYGFRQFFHWNRGKPQEPADPMRALSIRSFIDRAADFGCDGVELTAYYFEPGVTTTDLLDLRRHAFLRGIAISGSAVGNTFTRPHGPELEAEIASVKAWIDRAALLGAPHLRVFAGAVAKGQSVADARTACITALEACCDHAGTKGVMLGLENHGGIVATADGLLEIVRAVRSPWLGVNLDTGNFHSADPYADLARCVPYAVNVQYKVELQREPKGPKEPADAARIVQLLRDGGYQGFVSLEYEAAGNPYDAVPRHLEELRSLLG
jgi:sugar phosphate isomerase/epimerase